MRVLLAHNSLYYPAFGGGDRSNRLLLEALSARGHSCRVVARVNGFGAEEHGRFLADLAHRGVTPDAVEGGVVKFVRQGVEVHTVTSHANLRGYFAEQIAEFRPDVILVSTDDPAQLLLEAALRADGPRVVYLARATLAVPFGPDCAFPSAAKTAALRQVDCVVGVSQYVADYVKRWSGIPAVHVPISLPDGGPYPDLGRFDNEFVTMVNPCAVKGISIFLELVERMPDVHFAATPTWGSDEQDIAALRSHKNITVLDPVDHIDDLLKRTRALLVPSVWAEARSRIVVEAMLRGVPVLASNVGGIPEAKMGVPYLLPVKPIEKYQAKLDAQMVPIAEVPPQDVRPWEEALRRITADRAHYEQISCDSRAAALAYAEKATIEPFEELLQDLLSRRERTHVVPPAPTVDRLTPEKRRLLALRMKKAAASAWFPKAETDAPLRIFCLPYAGGGALAYRGWSAAIGNRAAVLPARLPGREGRLNEPPIDRIEPLIKALLPAMEPYLGQPFALFGHSMGAIIAFEIARELRRRSLPLPATLFVSGCRAAQLLAGRVPGPDPSDEDLVEELRKLGAIPEEILQHEDLMRVILPALRADSALYRNYQYRDEPPLPMALSVFGGKQDARIGEEQFRAWQEQTTGPFHLHLLPGGHFFFQENPAPFWEAFLGELDSHGG